MSYNTPKDFTNNFNDNSFSYNSAEKYNSVFQEKNEEQSRRVSSISSRRSMDDTDTDDIETEVIKIISNADKTSHEHILDERFNFDGSTIFTALYPRKDYKDSSNCTVCKEKFSRIQIKAKKHCKFCGNTICNDCGKKNRANPEDKTQYVRICDNCEEQYILKLIYDEFLAQREESNKIIQEYTNDLVKLQKQLQEKKITLESLKHKQQIDGSESTKKEELVLKQIDMHRNEIKLLEEEVESYDILIKELKENLAALKYDYERGEEEHAELIKECELLKKQMAARDMDIKQTNNMIKELEDALAGKKPEKQEEKDSFLQGANEIEQTNNTTIDTATTDKGDKPNRRSSSFKEWNPAQANQNKNKTNEKVVSDQEVCKACTIM